MGKSNVSDNGILISCDGIDKISGLENGDLIEIDYNISYTEEQISYSLLTDPITLHPLFLEEHFDSLHGIETISPFLEVLNRNGIKKVNILVNRGYLPKK